MTQAPAMFSRTGGSDFPSHLKMMISGPPKSGKTTLLGTVPNLLVLDTEPHANNLQSIAHLDVPFKAIHSTDDLRQAQFILSNDQFRAQAAQQLGLPAIEAVAIDTMDTLQAIMKRERMREQRSTQFMRDDWGWIKEEMASIIESFTSLPMHVFFIVHTKTKDVGTEKNPRTVILPGLEGSIAESIAGMVGYSVLSFRKEEVRSDGSKFTKYWLRAEGDETYEFLGNRAAGRLPDIIEPDFKTIYDAAMAGRPTQQHTPVQVDLSTLQTTGQTQQPATPQQAPQASTPAAAPTQAAPAAEVPAQNAGQAAAAGPAAADRPADSEPINAAALGFVKRVYDAIGQTFPEEIIKGLTLGEARSIVSTFKAVQQDAAEGKGGDLATVMTEFLGNSGWITGAAPAEKVTTPKVDGTIDEVKAYATDLEKVQEAYNLETAKASPRSSLVTWLEAQGAQVPTPVQSAPATPAPAATPTPEPEQTVTPAAPEADQVSEEQGVQNAKDGLGASQVVEQSALCEECGNPIDDVDLAELGQKRYNRTLCVKDYLAEGKK